jgi:hypothetical protein
MIFLPFLHKYWWRHKLDKLQMFVAWRLPRWLVRWAAVRLVAHATTGRYGHTLTVKLTAVEALRRWDEEGKRP